MNILLQSLSLHPIQMNKKNIKLQNILASNHTLSKTSLFLNRSHISMPFLNGNHIYIRTLDSQLLDPNLNKHERV